MINGRENVTSELEFLGSMVNLEYVPASQQDANAVYHAESRAYNCDPCDGCGAAACAADD